MRASALFLRHLTLLLMPCLTALAPDLTLVEMEDVDTVDRSEAHDDFAEDFVDIKRVKKKQKNSAHLYMIQPDPNELFFIGPDAIAWRHEDYIARSCGGGRVVRIHNGTS